MIRSRLANAFVLILGLSLLTIGGAFGLAAIEEARGTAFLGLSNLLPCLVNLALGFWCVRGAFINLKHARHEPPPASTHSLLAMRVLAFVFSAALVVTFVCVILLGRGNDGVIVERVLITAAATLAWGSLLVLAVGVISVFRRKKTAA